MPAYTVRAVEQSANGGEGDRVWTRQKLLLENQAGQQKEVSLFCNRFTPVPKVGDVLEGDVQPNEKNPAWLPELKLPRKGGGGGGGPRPEDPKRMASIAMQHSQDTALRMVTWALENGLIKQGPGGEEMNLGALAEFVRVQASIFYLQVQDAQAKS